LAVFVCPAANDTNSILLAETAPVY